MLKQCVSIILMAGLVHLGIQPALGVQEDDRQAEYTTRIRAAILELGIGPDAETTVRLRDGAVVNRQSFSGDETTETTAELRNSIEIEGYISEAGEEYFTITDSDVALSTEIAYRDVVEIDRDSGGVRNWLIPVAVIGGIALGVLYLACQALCDD